MLAMILLYKVNKIIFQNLKFIKDNETHLKKIRQRVEKYQIEELNPPRPGSKLLVLDIDYTLFDHRSPAERASQLMRPYLHEFLTESYNKKLSLN